MKPTIEQIDAAIDVLNGDWFNEQTNGEHTINYAGFMNAVSESYETILFALHFTKKMMGEPSEDAIVFGMEKSVLGRPSTDDDAYVLSIFKAMRDQAIREVEDEN